MVSANPQTHSIADIFAHLADFTMDRLDEPVCMIDNSGNAYYYYYDGLGSVTALSHNGVVVERYQYDPYGITAIYDEYGSRISKSNHGNRFMFTGREFDAETGLYYYRARMYSPGLGRFLQPDPIGYADGMNLYAYCGNNPVNFVDPWGLCQEGTIGNPIKLKTKDLMRNSPYMRHLGMDGNQNIYDLLRRGPLYHNPLTFLYYAGFWDSGFYGRSNTYFSYQGHVAKGSEVNYYVMGMLMARYGLTWDACMATIYAWKLENIAMGDDTYKLPSSEELYWMRKGWMDERRRMREGR